MLGSGDRDSDSVRCAVSGVAGRTDVQVAHEQRETRDSITELSDARPHSLNGVCPFAKRSCAPYSETGSDIESGR